MQELATSANNPYFVIGILFITLSVASISFYRNLRNYETNQSILFWIKLIVSIPLLILGLGFMLFATMGFGTAALIGTSSLSLKLVALTLAPIFIFLLATWGLVRWIRNKKYADASVIIVILLLVGTVYSFNSEWVHSIL